MTLRLFVAVDPPGYAADHLAEVVSGLHVARAGARLAAPERWHLTLAFLGDVAEERVDAVTAALAAAADGPSAHPMRLRLAGGGTFGRRAGTVLWTGVAGEVERLRQLARALGRELRRARVRLDRKPYRPHLTIARPGDRLPRGQLAEDIAALAAYQGPQWPVAEFHLIRSHLGATPHHQSLTTFPLPTVE